MSNLHNGFVVRVKDLRPHTNADKLQIAKFFDCETCVGLNVNIGDVGIYFPSGLQLSEEYCEANNLVRKLDENGNNIGGYLEPSKRNVKTIKLRGEPSDGMFMPLSSLEYTNVDMSTLAEGTLVSTINGHEICRKYIPPVRPAVRTGTNDRKIKKRTAPIAPLFAEHVDTVQLAYNLDAFKPGDLVEVSLKVHGTSQRTGHLKVLKGYKRTLLDKLFRREGTPIYDWDYVSGTRRTILNDFEGGFYGSNQFREPHAKFFEGKLHRSEQVYYEICGFVNENTPIMGSVQNSKLNDKDFIRQYGDTTIFTYGCDPTAEAHLSDTSDAPRASDIYVYRMTMTNEDGVVVEYSPEFMRYRCEQMGVKCVPVFFTDYIGSACQNPGKFVEDIAKLYYDGPDPIDPRHIREGVVVRIVNRPTFTAFKYKNFNFKVLSGIIAENATNVDNPDIAAEL